MSSNRINKYLPILWKLAKAKTIKKRKQLLNLCDKYIYDIICDICYNVKLGKINIPPTQIKKLLKHKKHIRELADGKISIKKKRNIINQKGGFLPGLLVPALSILSSIAAKKFLE